MQIQIDPHTLERATERGATEAEIYDTLLNGFDVPAKQGRRGKAAIYQYKATRLNKYYEQKRVEVYYTIERDKIITVTVYVFYGSWEG